MSSSGFPDPRRHAYRADLADARLKGLIEAERYVQGEPRQVVAPLLPLRRDPRPDSTLETEALKGETVTVFAESEGWTWVQIDRDLYVGYMPSEGLSASIVEPTHRIAVLRTYVFPEPDAKSPPLALLSLNALVTAEAELEVEELEELIAPGRSLNHHETLVRDEVEWGVKELE